MDLPLESVPNVSEGRDADVIERIAAAFGRSARVLDVHSDADHNRSVVTLVGGDEGLADALVEGVAAARDAIDLRRHDGAHPRIGAAGRTSFAGASTQGTCSRTSGRRGSTPAQEG